MTTKPIFRFDVQGVGFVLGSGESEAAAACDAAKRAGRHPPVLGGRHLWHVPSGQRYYTCGGATKLPFIGEMLARPSSSILGGAGGWRVLAHVSYEGTLTYPDKDPIAPIPVEIWLSRGTELGMEQV